MSSTDFLAPRLQHSRLLRLREAVAGRTIPADVIALCGIVLIAVVIRILTIDNQSFWTDEALTSYETRISFGAMLSTVAHFETTPPLYFSLIWFWAKVFGHGEVALRSFSELAGVALVPIAYVSGRELVSRWVGVLTAAFVAVNPLMVWFSQEARAYMLLALLSALGFLWFTRAYREPSRRNIVWWTVLASLSLMTHFFAGFIVAPEAIWLLYRWRSRLVAGAIGVVVLVQLAMAPFALFDTTHGTQWIHAIPRVQRIGNLVLEWDVGTMYRRLGNGTGLLGGLVVLVVVGLLLRYGADRELRSRLKLPAGIAAFVFIVPLIFGLFGADYFFSRNEIPAFVPAAIVLATACLVPRLRVLGLAFAAVMLAVFSIATIRVQTNAYLQRPPWKDLAGAIGKAPVQRAVLVADGTPADPLKIYLPGVKWVENHYKPLTLGEVDVVGARKNTALQVSTRLLTVARLEHVRLPHSVFSGYAVPRSRPKGIRLIARFRVNNWVVGRYGFAHPLHVSLRQLVAIEQHFFTRNPRQVLVFSQAPA
ncbi:MAG: glycosyltransferase family 39 protein [Solirubrobacterales bacterium]|nr:glycosyltransferase family 39 protein [Solirubrobacterales bacterium]